LYIIGNDETSEDDKDVDDEVEEDFGLKML
jgi:hypothetical protein